MHSDGTFPMAKALRSYIFPFLQFKNSALLCGFKTSNCKLPFMDEDTKAQRREKTIPFTAVMAVPFTTKPLTPGALL